MFLETSIGKYVGFILALGVTDLLRSKGREISLPYENRDGFLEQKFWLSRLLPRTVLLDLDTGADDGPAHARTNI